MCCLNKKNCCSDNIIKQALKLLKHSVLLLVKICDGFFEGVIAFRILKFSFNFQDLSCFDDNVFFLRNLDDNVKKKKVDHI